MLDVVILENTLSISMDLRTNSWDYIALLVEYKSTTEHVRDSDICECPRSDSFLFMNICVLSGK